MYMYVSVQAGSVSPPPAKRQREEPTEEDEEDKQVAMVRIIPNKAHSLLPSCTSVSFDVRS
jgi:hypothetical protein